MPDGGAADWRPPGGAPVPLRRLAAVRGPGQRIGRGELLVNLPATSRRPRSRRELMRAFHADPRLAGLHPVRAANVTATLQILARQASWADGDPDPRATTRPTRALIAALARYCISTWKACRQVLEELGYLVLIRQGRTEEWRHKSPDPANHYPGNDAAVFLLAVPRSPAWPRRGAKSAPAAPPAAAPEGSWPPPHAAVTRGTPRGAVDDVRAHRTGLRPGSLATPALRLAIPAGSPLQRLSDKALSRLWRPWEARGWSVAEWLSAFDRRPDGSAWGRDGSGVRYPWSWALSRLRPHRGRDGRPGPPPLAAAAVRRHADRSADAAAAARTAAVNAPSGPVTDGAGQISRLRAERGWAPGRRPASRPDDRGDPPMSTPEPVPAGDDPAGPQPEAPAPPAGRPPVTRVIEDATRSLAAARQHAEQWMLAAHQHALTALHAAAVLRGTRTAGALEQVVLSPEADEAIARWIFERAADPEDTSVTAAPDAAAAR